MKAGLLLSDPTENSTLRDYASALLASRDIPFTGFTADVAAFPPMHSLEAFLRFAAPRLLCPGMPLPLCETLRWLDTPNALPANVLRRYVTLQLSLMPALATNAVVRPITGGFFLGEHLLIAPADVEGRVDCQLPECVWTDLVDSNCYDHAPLRLLRGLNALPVLVCPNTLLPVGVCDRRPDYDYADRVTLHWFQPEVAAQCTLPHGEKYTARRDGNSFSVHATTDKPWHLVVHRDGVEQLIY